MIDEPRRAPSARPGLFRPSTLRRLAVLGIALGALGARCNGTNLHEPVGHQTFSSPQAQPIVLSSDGALLFVAHTTSNRVSVVSTASLQESTSIPVGLEPVALAIKPDGSELWVSNHVSDSVSVVDLDLSNSTFLKVVATVQDIDANGVTQFDEPVGIAFASDAKAYVALSSRNDVAVVDTATYGVTGRIHITAQEPRALRVVGDRLYVAAFESNNQSELSICPDGPLPGLASFGS